MVTFKTDAVGMTKATVKRFLVEVVVTAVGTTVFVEITDSVVLAPTLFYNIA